MRFGWQFPLEQFIFHGTNAVIKGCGLELGPLGSWLICCFSVDYGTRRVVVRIHFCIFLFFKNVSLLWFQWFKTILFCLERNNSMDWPKKEQIKIWNKSMIFIEGYTFNTQSEYQTLNRQNLRNTKYPSMKVSPVWESGIILGIS